MSAGRRALRNVAARSGGDIVGKVLTFVLLAVLARQAGVEGLGTYLLALALAQVAMLPIEVGLDRLLVRRVAKRRADADDLFFNTLALKGVIAVPVLGTTFALLAVFGADDAAVVVLACVGALLESVTRSVGRLFTAHERGGDFAVVLVLQRALAATLGVAALLVLDGGPVHVAAAYAAGTGVAALASLAHVARRIGLPARRVTPSRWREQLRASMPFAIGDGLGLLLFRLDTLLLGALATTAAVGVYGAAYRLFDATLFLTYALSGAFLPMFTYLGRDTEPRVEEAFAGACKAGLAVLVPVAVGLAAAAGPITTTVFGDDLGDAATALAILAPAIPLLSLYTLSGALVSSRTRPQVLIPLNAGVVALNLALNLVLIPPYGPTGAAIAMLAATTAGAAAGLRQALGVLGPVSLVRLAGGPAVAGAAALGLALLLPLPAMLATAAGLLVYGPVLVLIERRLAPGDVAFLAEVLRRRTTGGGRATVTTA